MDGGGGGGGGGGGAGGAATVFQQGLNEGGGGGGVQTSNSRILPSPLPVMNDQSLRSLAIKKK